MHAVGEYFLMKHIDIIGGKWKLVGKGQEWSTRERWIHRSRWDRSSGGAQEVRPGCSECRQPELGTPELVLFPLARWTVNFSTAGTASSSFYHSPRGQHTHWEFSAYWLTNEYLTKCMKGQINKWMNKESRCKSLVTVITHRGQPDFCCIDYLYMRDLRIHVVKCVNSCWVKHALTKFFMWTPRQRRHLRRRAIGGQLGST